MTEDDKIAAEQLEAQIKIAGVTPNEILRELVFIPVPPGPLRIDLKTKLPPVRWRKLEN